MSCSGRREQQALARSETTLPALACLARPARRCIAHSVGGGAVAILGASTISVAGEAAPHGAGRTLHGCSVRCFLAQSMPTVAPHPL